MKQTQFLDDMGQVFAALFGNAMAARGKARTQTKQKFALLAQRMQLVTREEFDVLHGMLQQARMEQIELKKRIAALESKSPRAGQGGAVKRKVNGTLKKSSNSTKKSSRKRIDRS